MKKLLIFLFCSFSLMSCQSTKDALSLKKKDNTDEFLVEKKSPLVMPPSFNQLPVPKKTSENVYSADDNSIKNLIITKDQKNSTTQKKMSEKRSIEKKILEIIE